jgi:hypothetical protein
MLILEGIGKTEYDIDTWSYREGIAQGYIPTDVSNASTLIFPILGNGCVDAGFNYTAPKKPGRSAGSRSYVGTLGVGWLYGWSGSLGCSGQAWGVCYNSGDVSRPVRFVSFWPNHAAASDI